MRYLRDFPLITALILHARATTVPIPNVEQCRALTRRKIPDHLIPQFTATEHYLARQTSAHEISIFYRQVLEGKISIPLEHETVVAYAAGSR